MDSSSSKPSFLSRIFNRSSAYDKSVKSILDEGVKISISKGSETKVQTAVKEMKRPSRPVKFNLKGQSSIRPSFARDSEVVYYQSPQYNLYEISRCRDVDSLFQTSIERHVEQVLSQGYKIDGEDQEMVEYVKKRLFEIEVLSEKTIDEILKDAADQVAAYGTALFITKRDIDRSSGGRIRKFGVELDPISTLAVADSPQMKVALGKQGKIKSWKQDLEETSSESYVGNTKSSNSKEFPYYDVYIAARHGQPSRIFGRPMVISVLDDIASLRRLEELMDIIPQKHLFPLYQYIVGTEDMPAGEIQYNGVTISEVELARQEIENMPTEGGFVTPERHEIKIIGAEGKVLDIMPYVEHFRNRVQQGLRLSDTVLGSGSSQTKGVGQAQVASLHDSARTIQRCIEAPFNRIILDILMEGGFEVTHENIVRLSFNHPNKEETRADELHNLNMFSNGAKTEDEVRKSMGHKPMTEGERKKTGLGIIHEREKEIMDIDKENQKEVSKADANAQEKIANANVTHEKAKAKTHEARVKVEEARAEVAKHTKKTTPKKKGKKSRSKSSRAAQVHRIEIGVKVQPRNQHGKKSTKTKVKKNDSAQDIANYLDFSEEVMAGFFEARSISDEPTLMFDNKLCESFRSGPLLSSLSDFVPSIPDGSDAAYEAACLSTCSENLDASLPVLSNKAFLYGLVEGLRQAGINQIVIGSDKFPGSVIILKESSSSDVLFMAEDTIEIGIVD